MWRRVSKLLLLLCLLPSWCWSAVTLIKGEQHWSGQVELAGPMQVAPGALLTIEAGTRVVPQSSDAKLSVRGRLQVKGSSASPVHFVAPEGWQGIEFVEAEAGSQIRSTEFTGGRTAVTIIATSPEISRSRFAGCEIAVQLLRESNALIAENHFVENQVGLKVGLKSNPQVLKNRFERQEKTAVEVSNGSGGLFEGNTLRENTYGMVLQQKLQGEIRGNSFSKNKVALLAVQTRNTPLIEGNQFSDNEEALQAFSFSYPAIQQNRFVDNGIAVHNDQFGSPLIEGNLFRNNDTAIRNNRKSNPKIQSNNFTDNRLVMFIDYSSYPEVKQNNFLANRQVAELGIYQSADWEKKAGSKGLVMQKAQARASRNPLLAQAPTEFSDQVDLSGNWWGEDTTQLEAAGPDANLELLFDRRDKPQVSYPGYGEESYQLDLIVYAPWLEQPVENAGPQEAP